MPPRVLASGPKPCGGNNLKIAYITLCFSLSREALRVCDLAQFLLYKSITPIFLSYHHRAFSITISSMESNNRGKCSCVECVEFVRGGGVLCDYCECAKCITRN